MPLVGTPNIHLEVKYLLLLWKKLITTLLLYIATSLLNNVRHYFVLNPLQLISLLNMVLEGSVPHLRNAKLRREPAGTGIFLNSINLI